MPGASVLTPADAKSAPSLHADTRVFPAGSRDPSLLGEQHPSMATAWMDPPSSWALPFLWQHRQSQGRAAGKGRHHPFAPRVRGVGGKPREIKEMAEPSLKSGTRHCQAIPQKCPLVGFHPQPRVHAHTAWLPRQLLQTAGPEQLLLHLTPSPGEFGFPRYLV